MRSGAGLLVVAGMLVATSACKNRESQVLPGLQSQNPVVVDDSLVLAQYEFTSTKVIALAEKALDDDDPKIRLDAAMALSSFQNQTSVEPLARHVDDPDSKVARAATTALGRLKSKKAAPALIAALQAHPDAPRLDVIWALGQSRSPDARPILDTLRRSSDPWTSYNATVALRTTDSP